MRKLNSKIHRPRKSLGQNFLKSEPALKKIIEAGEINPFDIILEIGPGKGALTRKLLATSCQLIAVEKDHNLYELLKDKFKKEVSSGQLELVHEDILDFDLKNYKLEAVSYKLIANIPYNITGAILKKFLTEKNQPTMMVLMVQNEVAKRILVRDGKESILSISVKAYGTPKMEMKVPARYFSPAPKVDSAIISIKNISRNFFVKNKTRPTEQSFGRVEEDKFWKIIRAGFAHKRKKLSSNLKKLKINAEYGGLTSVEALGNKRAEELSLEDWINLVKAIDINKK
ncbi:MAG: 16S rRNA (adenine(1518)-N(6)/adenine(1519)-N(6))-dimethyltransferase RsmA [Patescibacteria group bacterium]